MLLSHLGFTYASFQLHQNSDNYVFPDTKVRRNTQSVRQEDKMGACTLCGRHKECSGLFLQLPWPSSPWASHNFFVRYLFYDIAPSAKWMVTTIAAMALS